MTFIIIHLITTVGAFVLLWLNSVKATQMFKAKYPDLTIPRRHWSDRVISIIEVVLIHICPIINIAFLLIYITKSDELCEKTIDKTYMRCMDEIIKRGVSE